VDSFTSKPFADKLAALCPLASYLDDDLLQAVAAESDLLESAFLWVPAEPCHLWG
jgi:predicted PhzF superfamily epimerase YddE/YHI9